MAGCPHSYRADIVIFDSKKFRARADYQNPDRLSEGVEYLIINGIISVDKRVSKKNLPGKVIKPCSRRKDKQPPR